MFRFNSEVFGGSRLWIVNKTPFYTGGSAFVTVHDPSAAASLPGSAFTLQPAHMFGTGPNGMGTFLVSTGWAQGSTDGLSIIRVDNPLANPTFSNQFISLGNITGSTFPDAPQKGTAVRIETNDVRALNAVWRNNVLWTTNTVVPPSGPDAGQATAHWYKINTSNLASLSLQDQGDVGGEDIASGTYTFFPSIAVDASGNMAVGFAASGPNIYPGAYYTGRLAYDPAGTVQPTGVLRSGLDFYRRTFSGTRNRWGDYSGISVDPVDDATFWIFNEYAITRGTILPQYPVQDGRWGTAFGSFAFAPTPSLSINDVSVTEGNTGTVNANFTVTLSAASENLVTVDYITANGTATAGSDYVASLGAVTFPVGSTTQTITVVVNGDVIDEPNELFFVNLSNPTNAPIADDQGLGTINDDDPAPLISINDVTVTEGNTGTVNANFTVTLSTASSQVVTVNYATANVTATAGSDYVAKSGIVTFPAGTTTQTLTVVVNGDA
ncbi:hemolysin, partial [candidate division KSB1 bacterium]|nr:hemolysin [candidate division KSB1 bacterium]